MWSERGPSSPSSSLPPPLKPWFATKSARNTSIRFPSASTFSPRRTTSKSSFWRTVTVPPSYRAVGKIAVPLLGINLYAIALTCVDQLTDANLAIGMQFDSTYMFALTTTLSLMLVFRLSRAAVRWWDSRMMWGLIIAKVRQISCRVVGFNVKGTEAARLQVLMDLVVFSVAARCYLRSNPILPSDLSGVAGPETIEQLNSCDHMVLKAGMILTKRLVGLHEGNPSGPQLNVALEGKLKLVDDLVQTAGGLERIKNSPLPIIYTAHLRTFLILYFIILPFLALGDLGWYTIPMIAVSSFVFLGVEGAASDVDDGPFYQDRVNHVDVDGMVGRIMGDVEIAALGLFELDARDAASTDHK